MNVKLKEKPHIRFNALSGEWILVSPHRLKRPWQGKQEEVQPDTRPQYDPKCYLCPGNERSGGEQNPKYEETFCFTNDFAALLPEGDSEEIEEHELLKAQTLSGICRVICFSPRHDLTIPRLSREEIGRVIQTWQSEFKELSARDDISYVTIFENKGAIMGCSNPHPHGQIWATQIVPMEPMKEDVQLRNHFEKHGNTLLEDYIAVEKEKNERIVVENETWIALVPYWAKWPYETIVIPKSPKKNVLELSEQEETDLADILKVLTTKYDNLFTCSFPYTMGFHQAPCDGEEYPHWHMHLHFYPPLLRSATVQKFMVGFEMLACPQRDITAEMAADTIKNLSDTHYLEK